MSRSESVVVTALCMVYDNDKILLQDRIKEDWKGVTFPGGHIEKKESFVKGIEREVFEETGLKIKNIRICGVKQFQTEDDERYIVLLFKTNEFEGELCSSEEGEVFLAERKNLSSYETVDDFYELIKVFDDENINELMFEDCKEDNHWKWIKKLYCINM